MDEGSILVYESQAMFTPKVVGKIWIDYDDEAYSFRCQLILEEMIPFQTNIIYNSDSFSLFEEAFEVLKKYEREVLKHYHVL